jgi:hypothetical protein
MRVILSTGDSTLALPLDVSVAVNVLFDHQQASPLLSSSAIFILTFML